MKIKFYLLIIFLTLFTNLHAGETYFIDLSKVLNQSKAGADFQNKLKKIFKIILIILKKQKIKLEKKKQI